MNGSLDARANDEWLDDLLGEELVAQLQPLSARKRFGRCWFLARRASWGGPLLVSNSHKRCTHAVMVGFHNILSLNRKIWLMTWDA